MWGVIVEIEWRAWEKPERVCQERCNRGGDLNPGSTRYETGLTQFCSALRSLEAAKPCISRPPYSWIISDAWLCDCAIALRGAVFGNCLPYLRDRASLSSVCMTEDSSRDLVRFQDYELSTRRSQKPRACVCVCVCVQMVLIVSFHQ